jgi:hypothetical protein
MDELRLLAVIKNSHRMLVAGPGGGFDVSAGLPSPHGCGTSAEKCFLQICHSPVSGRQTRKLTRALYTVESNTTGPDFYFPERILARFL